MGKKSGKNIGQFFLELGVLKRFPRTGWLRAGIENPESIADHSFRTAMIAWAIAEMENSQFAVRSKQFKTAHRKPLTANPDINTVIKMSLLHDIEESRTGDLDMVMKRYHPNGSKKKAYFDILKNSPYESEAHELVQELFAQKTLESKIVKDADKIELFLQAFEYEAGGFREAAKWKHSSKIGLKLKSSKDLIRQIEKQEINWWYP